MPSALQDGSIQRVTCDAVKGSDEGILQVLRGFYGAWWLYHVYSALLCIGQYPSLAMIYLISTCATCFCVRREVAVCFDLPL
jgi:hypothetical protein